jgi:hypothetical protein
MGPRSRRDVPLDLAAVLSLQARCRRAMPDNTWKLFEQLPLSDKCGLRLPRHGCKPVRSIPTHTFFPALRRRGACAAVSIHVDFF